MKAKIKQWNWVSLRQEAISTLERIELLLESSQGFIPLTQQEQTKAKLQGALVQLRVFELRLAIVATTKAGKSTLVNALIGQELLPSRDASVTILPTEVIHASEETEPVLHIPSETIESFRQTWQSLHRKLNELVPELIDKKTSGYPIKELLQNIILNPNMAIESTIKDAKNIERTLFLLNDLCRLSLMIEPDLSPFHYESGIQLPRLTVPFHSAKYSHLTAGRLVIIDCPGPNEARIDQFLSDIVKKQLQQAGVVLHVFNYQELTNDAFGTLRERFRALLDLIKEESIIGVVNKIDQRERDDERDPERQKRSLSPEQIRQFISTQLNFKNAASEKRIFEVSARNALNATRFLRELAGLGEAPSVEEVRALRSTPPVARVVLGSYWEEDFDSERLRKLKTRAEDLLQKSGFPRFFSDAIAILLRTVAARILRDTLSTGQEPLLEQFEQVALRLSTVDADEARLKNEIKQIELEISAISQQRAFFKKRIQKTSESMNKIMKDNVVRLRRLAKIDIEFFLRKHPHSKQIFLSRFRDLPKHVIDALGGNDIEAITRLIFDSRKEADAFVQGALDFALEQAKPDVERLLQEMKLQIDAESARLEDDVARSIQPIIQRAYQRVRQEFSVSLMLPSWKFGSLIVESNTESSIAETRTYKAEKLRYERLWYTFWILKGWVLVESTEIDYSVDLQRVSTEASKMITKRIEEIHDGFGEFVLVEFALRVDDYFNRLENYFQKYREILNASISAQQQSLGERKLLKSKLKALREDLRIQIQHTKKLQRHIREVNDKEVAQPCKKVCIIFDAQDRKFVDELEGHLTPLCEEGLIQVWHEGKIQPGSKQDVEMGLHLEEAHFILVVVSPTYVASAQYRREIPGVCIREQKGLVCVIPILWRSCNWQFGELARLKALPGDGIWISGSRQRDTLLTALVQDIRTMLDSDEA